MKLNSRKINEKLGFFMVRMAAVLVVFILAVILYDIFSKGGSVISWEFITQKPRKGITEGGIWPAIVGTFWVSLITVVFAVPVGMFTAIYLNEYAIQGRLIRIIRLAIRNLSGVPSIVYGLFGFALFVLMLNIGLSALSAGLTLGLLTLPWTITASEEALKTVPMSYREGALALGATKWQTIRSNVLPYAVPGMLTGTILGLARAAGETAPILFTGAAFFWPILPSFPKVLVSQFMALPYHLFIMSTQHHEIVKVRPLAYGTAFVLIVLVLSMNILAVWIRYRFRKKYKRV
ncbi:phosphate ABC transporter permease PstA [candidate division KSB1 bacterium]|nr:phosphate ABC transporter permease PstA [candidate division KSB1 bacterium]